MITHYKHTPVFYESYGAGPALILLHGFLESSKMWDKVVSKFKDQRTIVTIDLLGHGKSGVLDEIHTMEEMAQVVIQVLDELAIDSAMFIGHSMGGYVALALLEHNVSRVAAFVLLNSTTEADNPERKANRNRAAALIERNKENYVRMSLTNLYHKKASSKFACEIATQKDEAAQFPAKGLQAAQLGMRDRPDRTAILANFSKEKYIITGLTDTVIPFKDIKKIAAITNTPLFQMEGGHMSITENWEGIDKILHLIV